MYHTIRCNPNLFGRRIVVAGCYYDVRPEVLHRGAEDFQDAADHIQADIHTETDATYRLMAVRAYTQRADIASILHRLATVQESFNHGVIPIGLLRQNIAFEFGESEDTPYSQLVNALAGLMIGNRAQALP